MERIKLSELVKKPENQEIFGSLSVEDYDKLEDGASVTETEIVSEAVEKMTDSFDFHKGQITMLGMEWGGEVRYSFPVLVTKAHDKDINLHNTYDYLTLVKGNCEFASIMEEHERYMWRFVIKGETIPEWYIEALGDGMFDEEAHLDKSEIFYIEGDEAIYPFRNIKTGE